MATTSGGGRSKDSKSLKKKASMSMAATRCLHTMAFERLKLPKQVEMFDEFEELSKMYSIEMPFLPRSQVELVFDVFDGKKLQSANLLDDLIDAQTDQLGATSGFGKSFEPQTISGQKAASNSSNQFLNANRQESATLTKLTSSANSKSSLVNTTRGQSGKINKQSKSSSSSSSWSKLLLTKQRLCSSNGMQLKCCLAKSETSQDFCMSPSDSSTNAFVGPILAPKQLKSANASNADRFEQPNSEWQQLNNVVATPTIDMSTFEALNVALCTDLNDDNQDDVELKEEVWQLISPLISELRRCSTLSEVSSRIDLDQSSNNLPEQQQQQNMILDTAFDSSNVSICLFDKRSRLIKLKNGAENGRRWAKTKSRLNELCFKLTGSTKTNSLTTTNLIDLEYKVDKFIRNRMPTCLDEKYSSHERISKSELEQLIDLTKNSLNNLIDAQLLLRNKLTTEQQQQQVLMTSINSNLLGNDLLRNNFNLLKIWQNIEETKRLVCFVCEPIKANLNDLFWFSRKHAIEDLSLSTTTTTYSDHCLLSSPLISLDTIQVKRGLLQVSSLWLGFKLLALRGCDWARIICEIYR